MDVEQSPYSADLCIKRERSGHKSQGLGTCLLISRHWIRAPPPSPQVLQGEEKNRDLLISGEYMRFCVLFLKPPIHRKLGTVFGTENGDTKRQVNDDDFLKLLRIPFLWGLFPWIVFLGKYLAARQ